MKSASCSLEALKKCPIFAKPTKMGQKIAIRIGRGAPVIRTFLTNRRA